MRRYVIKVWDQPEVPHDRDRMERLLAHVLALLQGAQLGNVGERMIANVHRARHGVACAWFRDAGFNPVKSALSNYLCNYGLTIDQED